MKLFQILFFTLFSLISADVFSIKDPEIIMLRQGPDALGLYEKFEVSFNIKNGNEYVNPFDPPYMKITGGHANYIGQDMAFILKYLPEPAPLPVTTKKSKR